MPLAHPDESDVDLAASIAWAAGRLLRRLRAEPGAFDDPEALGDRGDRQADDLIHEALRDARPNDVVLSEESADDPRRLTADRVWIIDPLDGTRQYKTEGSHDWAVHVALWERSPDGIGALTAAAVSLPDLGAMYRTDLAGYGDDDRTGPNDLPIIVVSDSRPPDVSAVAELLSARIVSMGSAGAKIMAVVRGDADAYIHWGGQYQWDSAAPVAIAQAYGLHASRVDGSPLIYNLAETSLPDLVVCRTELATAILNALTK